MAITRDGTPVAHLSPLPAPALIASTAVANDLPLYTRNPSDFVTIDGLELYPVESLLRRGRRSHH